MFKLVLLFKIIFILPILSLQMPHTVYHVNCFRCATLLHNTLQPHTAKLKPCNFTKSNTTPWVFFTFFKLYKWHQIAQNITYVCDMYRHP